MTGDGYSSPACFLHELDPAWLGQLGLADTVALVDAVLAANWPLPPALREALRGDRDRLALQARHSPFRTPPAEADDRPLARRLRAVLSRIADDALHARLATVCGIIDQDQEAGGTAMTTPSLPEQIGTALLGSASDAVIHADGKGVIRFWNPGAERIFGFTAAEAVGQSLDIIIPPPQRARHWEGFDHTMATGESRYGAGDLLSVPALKRDGTRISVEFTIVPIHDERGAMSGMVAVLRDVSKRFEEVRALRRELAQHRAGSTV